MGLRTPETRTAGEVGRRMGDQGLGNGENKKREPTGDSKNTVARDWGD